ncbi:MAG: hypothetical protein ABJD11_01770 [Gemmatimonadota bacterium]
MRFLLSFKLKVAGTDEFRGLKATSTSYRFHGILRLDGSVLTIEWGGVAQVQEFGATTIRDNRLPLPDDSVEIPVELLYRAALAGGWWLPRLRLRAGAPGVLSMVPSEELGAVEFWYARADRDLAITMVAAINKAIADSPSALDEASEFPVHAPVPTPPGTSDA